MSELLTDLGAHQGEPRMSLGWRLAKAAWRLLRRDRGLLVVVLLLAVLYAVEEVLPLLVSDLSWGIGPHHQHHLLVHALAGAVYVFGGVFLLTATAIAVDAAIDGVPTNAREALREAAEILGPILRWSLLSVAVWYGGQIASNGLDTFWPLALLTFGWFLASFFVIPVMAIERTGPGEALAESMRLVREGWRQTLAGVLGIGLFYGIVVLVPALMLSHASALHREGDGVNYPLVIAALALLGLVVAAATATFGAFGVILERQIVNDLPGAEYSGRRLPRGKKVLRFCGAFVLVILALGGFSAANKHDRQINAAAQEPGANFTALVANPGDVRLPTGSPVLYERRRIGTVLGAHAQGSELKVSFHLQPGFGPTSTPASLVVVDAGLQGPTLILVPSRSGGSAPEAFPS